MCNFNYSNYNTTILSMTNCNVYVQCVQIKRKPILSVRYLYCHARLKQTIQCEFKKRKPEFDSKYLKIDKRCNNTDFSG